MKIDFNKKILVIGDIMLDKYIFGEVNRISPEAPIPILRINKEDYRLGGAANVAANIVSLGGQSTLIGAIGQDKEGEMVKSLLRQKNISFISIQSKNTTIKTRYIGNKQQLLRTDFEETENKNVQLPNLQEFDTIIISDYAKGMVTKDLFNKLNHKNIIINLKPQNANICKNVSLVVLNESESRQITNILDIYETINILYNKFKTNIIITRGEKGMLLYPLDRKPIEIPTTAKEVYDVTGAGDTAIATLGLASASGLSLEEAAVLANHAAGITITKLGTATVKLSELENILLKEESKITKIKTREELKDIVERYKEQNKRMIWTNGCFDLIHEGHIRYLKRAKELGDILIVGLNSDESVRQLKGEKRPIRPEKARAEVLAALEYVDYVTIFPELKVTNLLKLLQPDIYVKASDYNLETMNQEERRVIEEYKGQIHFVPIESDISTSKIIDQIRK